MIRARHFHVFMLLGSLLSVVFFLQCYDDTKIFYSPKLVKKYNDTYKYTFLKCERNMDAAKISGFDGFPSLLKDFLYYRHCRDFPMILDLPDKCGGIDEPENIFLLLVIKSSPVHYERREVLRKTWAQERLYKGLWIRRIFILGTTGTGFEKERLTKLLKIEQQEHNDILQWDFQDTFFNLTLKQVLFFKWMKRNCLHVNFLLNGDDDVFANTDNIVEYLQNRHNNNGSEHLFTGYLIRNGFPVRWDRSKYFVPFPVYKPNMYPNYCGGGGFLLSSYTALKIYSFSDTITLFPIDDVYMGMCLEKAKLAPASHMGVKTLGWYIPSKKIDQYDPCYFKDYLLVHQFFPNNMYLMWHQINDPNLKCGIKNSSRTIQT